MARRASPDFAAQFPGKFNSQAGLARARRTDEQRAALLKSRYSSSMTFDGKLPYRHLSVFAAEAITIGAAQAVGGGVGEGDGGVEPRGVPGGEVRGEDDLLAR